MLRHGFVTNSILCRGAIFGRSILHSQFARRQLCFQARVGVANQTQSRHFTMTVPQKSTGRLIGTHDGTFHCDEALAVYLLRQTAEYKDAPVLRTRDQETLKTADVVVDVGGVFDASKAQYDHHQRGFEEHFSPAHTVTKLSSAGLVYRAYGAEVLRAVLKRLEIECADMGALYRRVYDSFIEAIDAVDNGVSIGEGPPKYRSSTDLSSRVGHLNAPWNAEKGSKLADQELNFAKAVSLVGAEFEDAVTRSARHWLPARAIVAKAFAARAQEHESGAIMVMRDWAPWKEHLFGIESEEDGVPTKYVIYEDSTGNGWRVQCVPEAPGSFQSRLPLPEQWRGLRDEQLSEKSGIPDCVFVHRAGFIGGNKTFQGAMQMASKSIVWLENE